MGITAFVNTFYPMIVRVNLLGHLIDNLIQASWKGSVTVSFVFLPFK